jgi:isoleucyl-tRNA synthetase
MSPHVPFITEHMYQNMKLVIDKNSKLNQESIHHVLISEVEPKLIDESIDEKMNNVMNIIESARKLRENKKISIKQPIMSLTIVNKSQDLFDNIKPFLTYIE